MIASTMLVCDESLPIRKTCDSRTNLKIEARCRQCGTISSRKLTLRYTYWSNRTYCPTRSKLRTSTTMRLRDTSFRAGPLNCSLNCRNLGCNAVGLKERRMLETSATNSFHFMTAVNIGDCDMLKRVGRSVNGKDPFRHPAQRSIRSLALFWVWV